MYYPLKKKKKKGAEIYRSTEYLAWKRVVQQLRKTARKCRLITWLHSKHCLSQQIQEQGWKRVEKHYADVFTNPLCHSEISPDYICFYSKDKSILISKRMNQSVYWKLQEMFSKQLIYGEASRSWFPIHCTKGWKTALPGSSALLPHQLNNLFYAILS